MIDDDDGDFFLYASWTERGLVALGFLVLAIIFYVIASSNESECLERSCTYGMPKFVDGECICASTPE